MELNAKISLQIIAHVANGLTWEQAFDAVLGAGAYLKMAGEVYDALKAEV